jgi:hypothetical protein
MDCRRVSWWRAASLRFHLAADGDPRRTPGVRLLETGSCRRFRDDEAGNRSADRGDRHQPSDSGLKGGTRLAQTRLDVVHRRLQPRRSMVT